MERILIVDDERTVRILLQKILEDEGYDCSVAESAEEARLFLQKECFNLLLTDFNMPGETGADLARFVKEDYPETAIVMVTVVDNPLQAREVLDIGIYGYIIKPFTRNMVLITVENALRRNSLELELQHDNLKLENDIHQNTDKLNEQLAFLQTLMDAIPSPLYYKDLNNVFKGCNKAFADSLRRKPEDIINRPVAEIVGEHQAKKYAQQDKELLKLNTTQVFETRVQSKKGKIHDILFHRAAYKDGKGEVSGIVGLLLDITERKEAEERLYSSEAKLRTIMDSLHVGVVMVNLEHEVLQVNRKIKDWFPGVKAAPGQKCVELTAKGDKEKICDEECQTKKTLLNGTTNESHKRLQTKTGERDFRVHSSPIFDKSGSEIIAAIEVYEDITEKIAVEHELRQAQKLESIGSLAAGVAHEINTPTQYAVDNLYFLEEGFTDVLIVLALYNKLFTAVKNGAPVDEIVNSLTTTIEDVDLGFLVDEIPATLSQIKDGMKRVANIVKAMREFSHPGSDEKVLADINQSLESTLTISRNEWKYVADMVTNLDEEIPHVPCLPSEINQVFLNIIVNAAQAIKEGLTDPDEKGSIEVTTRSVTDGVLISIKDSGRGIPVDVQNRVFDPFFTTKTIGKGTGQGLAISRSVVTDKHQGELWFETKENSGTTFFIKLPV